MSSKEIWKPLRISGKQPGVQYAVSNHGRFGVMDENGRVKIRRTHAQKNGYRYNFRVKGQSKAIFIHREVAKAFVKRPSPRHALIIRKDHDYLNDHSDNLQWVTRAEHRRHVVQSPNAVLSRKRKAIVKSPTAKVFDEETIRKVKRLIWDPKRKLTYRQIAERFGVSEMQIYRLKSGELWYHVRVENEPLHKKYKTNLLNIAWHQKNALPVTAQAVKILSRKQNVPQRKKGGKKRESGKLTATGKKKI